MSPSTPQRKINRRSSNSSDCFSAISNVIFFKTFCFMRVGEFWPRSSLKGDTGQCRLVKYSLEDSKILRQGNISKPPHIVFLNSHRLLNWSDPGLLGIWAWLQIRERKRWQKVVQLPRWSSSSAGLAATTNRKQTTLQAPAGKWWWLMPVERADLSSVYTSGWRQKTKPFQAEPVN